MTLEDFTTYTEVDIAEDRIQKTEYHVDHKAGCSEDTYLYKDKGVGHFGSNWEHLIDFQTDTTLTSTTAYQSIVYMISDVAKPWGVQAGSVKADNDDCIDIRLYRGIILEEVDAGTEYHDTYPPNLLANTWYYLRIKKVGTALTCKIYDTAASRDAETSDEHLLDTLSLTLHHDYVFRYIYGCNTVNTGAERWVNNDIENLDLQEVVKKAKPASIIPLIKVLDFLQTKTFSKRFPKFKQRLVARALPKFTPRVLT